MDWTEIAILIVALVYMFFDVWWFLRLAITRFAYRFRSKLSVKEVAEFPGIAWTTDIDYFCHMNNGRYFRHCDFARFDFYFRTGLSKYINEIPKAYVVQHASTIRYRKPLDFLMPFWIKTKLVYFDDRSLYFEQKFVTGKDEFVRAVALCKNTCVNVNVPDMMSKFGVKDRMECPEEVRLFIMCHEVSSNRLRLQANQISVATQLCDLADQERITKKDA